MDNSIYMLNEGNPSNPSNPGNPGNPGNPSSTVTKGYPSVEKEVTLNLESSDCFVGKFSTRVTGVTGVTTVTETKGNPSKATGVTTVTETKGNPSKALPDLDDGYMDSLVKGAEPILKPDPSAQGATFTEEF